MGCSLNGAMQSPTVWIMVPTGKPESDCARWGCLCHPACQRPSRDPPQPFPRLARFSRTFSAVPSQGKG